VKLKAVLDRLHPTHDYWHLYSKPSLPVLSKQSFVPQAKHIPGDLAGVANRSRRQGQHSMTLLTILLVCILAVSLLPALAEDDGWHLDDTYTLVNEELDPIIWINQQSAHLHKVIGGSGFSAAYNYDDYAAANCSSLAVQADKSNYWMPGEPEGSGRMISRWRRLIDAALYVRNAAGKFVGAPAKIRFYYFNTRSSPAEPISAFPKGLRMLVGEPTNKKPIVYAAFTCQVQADYSNSLVADNFNFPRDCPYGMKTEVYFPNCWDGLNLWTANRSHTAYAVGSVMGRDGGCPISHPIRIPQIQLEYTTPLAGNTFWSNGDSTAYGVHADFVNGWEDDVLSAALNNPVCGYGLNLTM
jgi:hypothetical protein